MLSPVGRNVQKSCPTSESFTIYCKICIIIYGHGIVLLNFISAFLHLKKIFTPHAAFFCSFASEASIK